MVRTDTAVRDSYVQPKTSERRPNDSTRNPVYLLQLYHSTSCTMVPGIEEKNGSFNTAFMRALTRLQLYASEIRVEIYTLYDKYDEMLIVISFRFSIRSDEIYCI